jgi:TolC family type I secretion outer membrane protein
MMLSRRVVRSARGYAFAALLLGTALSGCASNRTAGLGGGDITGSIGGSGATASAAPVLVSGQKMSLAAVVQYAMANNPDIGIARAQAKDAEAGINVARVPYMPTIDYSVAYGQEQTYATDTEIETNAMREEASIRASQLIWDFGKTGADINRAEALSKSAQLRLTAKTDETIMATIEAYLAVLELDLQIGISQQNVAAHAEMHRIVSLNEQAGNGTVADVQKALTRLEAARNQTIDLQAQRRSTASTFERVVGMAPGELQIPSPPAASRSVSQAEIENYIATSPLLLSLEQDKLSLQSQKQALLLDHLPRVTIDGTARYQMNVGGTNPARTDGRLMVTASGTLFDGMDRISRVDQIDARIEETEYRYRRAVDNLEYDIDDSARVLDTASSRLASIAGQIASGEEVVSLYTQQFAAGTRGIFEVLDAQQELSASRSGQVTAQFDVLRAKYRLLQLTGNLAQASN